MTLAELLWDNPLLIKHIRARLRWQQLLPFMIIVVILCACALWTAFATESYDEGGAFIMVLLLEGALLLLVGSSEVAQTVASARDSGMLDFHRISPQKPLATAIGFILGAPIREWALVAVTLPFLLVASVIGPPGPFGLLAILVVLILSALLFHTLALLIGCSANKGRGTGGAIAVLVLILHSNGPTLPTALFTVVPTATLMLFPDSKLPIHDTFFTLKTPVALLSLLHILPVLALAFVAAVRKMKSQTIPPYSKPHAVIFAGTMALLVLGDAMGFHMEDLPGLAPLITIYAVALASALLCLAVSPNAGEFAKGLRRARKVGLTQAPPWSDRAANWLPLASFGLITAAAGLLAGLPELGVEPSFGFANLLTAIVVAVGAVVTFGCGIQFFTLQFRKPGTTYFGLYLFLTWLLPLAVGALLMASKGTLVAEASKAPEAIMALSPVVGVSLAAASGYGVATMVAVLGSVVPAAVFVMLSLQAQRRATEAAGEEHRLAA